VSIAAPRRTHQGNHTSASRRPLQVPLLSSVRAVLASVSLDKKLLDEHYHGCHRGGWPSV
jgi:hypothetical protein